MPAGRPRKTVQDLKLSGTFTRNSSRKEWNTEVPQKLEAKPAPRKYLKRTKLAWHRFMDVKIEQGVLSSEDEDAVVSMFDALDSYYRFSNQLEKIRRQTTAEDLLDKSFRERLKVLNGIVRSSNEAYQKLAYRFGITPIERSKLSLPSGKPEDPLLEILGRKVKG